MKKKERHKECDFSLFLLLFFYNITILVFCFQTNFLLSFPSVGNIPAEGIR